MKEPSFKMLLPGLIVAILILNSSDLNSSQSASVSLGWNSYKTQLSKEALTILETKCNVCHRRQNPLMIFKEKNIAKRAPKVYKQVFLEKRMPKGDEIRLSQEEYRTLEKWLFTQKLF